MNKIRNICIYCGSSPGRKASYVNAARELAAIIVEHNIGLVYGGAHIGVMGAIADEVLRLGGQAVGVIPKALMHKEVVHEHLTELYVTHSMHERKTRMAELADGFIALPGGIGTLEELFEIWTWAQLGFHQKPCGLLNVEGYFDGLINFLDYSVQEEFIRLSHRNLLLIEAEPLKLIELVLNFEPPSVTQWIHNTEM
jgi:uncharacterized protein (TIGR00730 family)